MTRCNFLFTQFIKNNGTTGTFIANDFMAGFFFQGSDQVWRKAVLSEGFKGLLCLYAHHLPVPCHCVFAVAFLKQSGTTSHGMFNSRYLFEGVQIGQSKFL